MLGQGGGGGSEEWRALEFKFRPFWHPHKHLGTWGAAIAAVECVLLVLCPKHGFWSKAGTGVELQHVLATGMCIFEMARLKYGKVWGRGQNRAKCIGCSFGGVSGGCEGEARWRSWGG